MALPSRWGHRSPTGPAPRGDSRRPTRPTGSSTRTVRISRLVAVLLLRVQGADHGKPCKAAADDGVAMNRHDHLEHMLELFGTGSTKTTAPRSSGRTRAWALLSLRWLTTTRVSISSPRTPTGAKRGELWHLASSDDRRIRGTRHSGCFRRCHQDPHNIVDAEKSEIDQFPDFIKRVGHGVVLSSTGPGR